MFMELSLGVVPWGYLAIKLVVCVLRMMICICILFVLENINCLSGRGWHDCLRQEEADPSEGRQRAVVPVLGSRDEGQGPVHGLGGGDQELVRLVELEHRQCAGSFLDGCEFEEACWLGGGVQRPGSLGRHTS